MFAPWSKSTGDLTAGKWFILGLLVIAATFIGDASARNRRSFIEGRSDASSDANGKPQDDDFVPYQGDRFNRFDWSLLQIMAPKTTKGNVLISPISLKMALVLLFEGAQDETAQELARVMSLPVGIAATRERFLTVIRSLREKSPEYTLNFGTRIYVNNSITLRQRYTSIAKSFYDSDVLNADFTDTRTTAELINNFVNNVTEGHLAQLIANDADLQDNVMLIVNALYFKGSWSKPFFAVGDTINDVFYTSNNNSVQVPYMRSKSKFFYVYADDLNAKIIRLPYAGKKFSMFIILPEDGGLADLMKRVTPYIINRYLWLMQEVSIDLMLPKFKTEYTSHLENVLRELGIREIFDDTAKLTGVLRSRTSSKRLVVDDIVQKTGIEVNEQGTTAYAATEVEIGTKMSDETFHATQPFLFYIEEEDTGTIIYMGAVNNPLEENGMLEETTSTETTSVPTGTENRIIGT